MQSDNFNTDDKNLFFGFYRGIVKAHCDNGSCKIFFPGVYPAEYQRNFNKLPDAEQAVSLSFAGDDGSNGVFSYPKIDSIVWGFFENGDQNKPVYFASTMSQAKNTPVYDGLMNSGDNENLNLDNLSGAYQKVALSNRGKKNAKMIKIDNFAIKFNTDTYDMSLYNLSSDGSVMGQILLDTEGNITLSSTGTITLTAPTISIKAGEFLNLSSDKTVISSSQSIEAKSKFIDVMSINGATVIHGTSKLCRSVVVY